MKPKSFFVLLVLVYAVAFVFFLGRSLNLNFNGELIALLPADNPHIESYEKLENLNSSEGGFDLVLTTENSGEAIRAAQKVTNQILQLQLDGEPVFRNAELENDLYDIKYSALYLMTLGELQTLQTDVSQYIDDKKMEANPFYVELEEDEEAQAGLNHNNSVLLEEVSNSRRYTINADTSIISARFLPNFPKSNYNKLEATYQLLEAEKERIEQQENGVHIYWGGSYINHYHKINDVQFSVTKALVIGVLCLIVFLIGYMLLINKSTDYKLRYVLADLGLIFFILFSGFIITLGISTFMFDEINVFTGIVFSILFGINLDYILHLYSVEKSSMLNHQRILRILRSYFSHTKPILLSCLTTGLAIMSLIFADFDGFVQFGIIFFTNILVNLFSTYLFLLLSKSSHQQQVTDKAKIRNEPVFIEHRPQVRAFSSVAILALLMGGSLIGGSVLSFNFSFSDLEPQSEQSDFEVQAHKLSSGSSYFEPSYIITDTIAESKELFNHVKEGIGTEYEYIDRVESFSARYPISGEELADKKAIIQEIQQLLRRNEEFIETDDSEAAELIDIALNTKKPDMDSLPKYITNRFFMKNGDMAPLVIIYPNMSLSDGQRSILFRKTSAVMELDSGKTYYAASTSIIASSILELLINESLFLLITPLLTIIILLLIYYRSVLNMLIAVAPLLFTFGLLLSLRAIFEFNINLYNVIVLPIIIGVGADNGIHLVDALLNKKPKFFSYFIRDKFPVLAACSFTTILGFVGLLFINHPGMESLGVLAVAGISGTLAATYFTAILVQTFLLKR